jgi:hypothetical protein
MSETLIIVIGGVIAVAGAFLLGYFLRKRNTLEKSVDAIDDSKKEDSKRNKVIERAEEQINKNKEAIKNAESVLNNDSSSDK